MSSSVTSTTTLLNGHDSSATASSSQQQQQQPVRLKLKLRGRKRRRVHWAEDVEDNEDLCRKKSKCCCVFHRPRGFDESSSDEEQGADGRQPHEGMQI